MKTAKSKGGRPKGSRDVAGKVRWGILKAIENIDSKTGKGLAELIQEEIESKGIVEVLRALSSYSPKDMNVTATTLSPEQWLEVMADGSKPEGTEPEEALSGQLH